MEYNEPRQTVDPFSIESFNSELDQISEVLVRRSLSQYVVYTVKEKEAVAYLADKANLSPSLVREAELRGTTPEALAKLILVKADEMHSLVRTLDLVRLEYSKEVGLLTTDTERLALRDRMLDKIKSA